MTDEEKQEEGSGSRYKPEGYTEAFPTDMGEKSMEVASLLDLGKEAYQKENFNKAINYYNRALELDPANKEAKFLKRKTMATLSRLLDGKAKVEDDEEVERELHKAISIDLGLSGDTKLDDLSEEKRISTPVQRKPPTQKRDASVYKPPKQDFRKPGGTRVYSIPDTDKKFNHKAKTMSYRSGESYMERRETRILIAILIMFLIGVLFVSVYFEWITF